VHKRLTGCAQSGKFRPVVFSGKEEEASMKALVAAFGVLVLWVPAASASPVPRHKHEQDVVGMLLSIAASGAPVVKKHKPKIVGVLLPATPTAPPKQRRVKITPAKHTPSNEAYVPDSYFRDSGDEIQKRIGLTAVQVGVNFIPVAGTFIGMGIGTAACINRDSLRGLRQLYMEDRQLNRRWTAEDLQTNQTLVTQYVTPYCLPVIGGLKRASEASNPLEALFAIGGSVLDLSNFGVIPNAVATPLSIAVQGHDLMSYQAQKR
jgi:hypothetical protein